MDQNNISTRKGTRFPYAPTIHLCLTLLMATAANFRFMECKSMPINQLQIQSQQHQMMPSKIPMIFLTKPQQIIQQQQQPQQQQQFHHQQQFQLLQFQPQDSRPQGPSSISISRLESGQASTKPTMIMASSAVGPATAPNQAIPSSQTALHHHPQQQQQQLERPELIQTSASHLSATRQITNKQSHDQQTRASVPILTAATQAAEEADSDSQDAESDTEDEPQLPAGKFSQQDRAATVAMDSDDIEPTRRSSTGHSALNSGRATIEAVTRQRYNGPHSSAASMYRPDHRQHRDQPEAAGDDSGPATRKEQENAEASEAEVADRSALDEQQQAQREIILAQAQSEAKAIKEQQEGLLKQQALLQQILRRQDELNANRSVPAMASGGRGGASSAADRRYQQQRPSGRSAGGAGGSNKLVRQQKQQYRQQTNHVDDGSDDTDDSQFHQERRRNEGLVSESSNQDEEADYSFRRPLAIAARNPSSSSSSPSTIGGSIPKYGVSDLLPAAQHSYGAHYVPLHGYQKDYYQFAESFKKGQFHSGFKKGGKKFQISGHASQRKSHAEGHVKWNGSKGKGVSYWNYQHGGKKGYGGGGYFR